MNKFTRKTKLLTTVAIIVVLLAVVSVILMNNQRQCHDIIGDGYDMGIEREPVVIGNTCD